MNERVDGSCLQTLIVEECRCKSKSVVVNIGSGKESISRITFQKLCRKKQKMIQKQSQTVVFLIGDNNYPKTSWKYDKNYIMSENSLGMTIFAIQKVKRCRRQQGDKRLQTRRIVSFTRTQSLFLRSQYRRIFFWTYKNYIFIYNFQHYTLFPWSRIQFYNIQQNHKNYSECFTLFLDIANMT